MSRIKHSVLRNSLAVMSYIMLHSYANSQDYDFNAGRISPKELTIPASPIFDIMGVTPAQVNRTADIKDFKVDWSFQYGRFNPNLAIQSQPIWELFYNRKDLKKYQNASSFMRMLSSLDVSVGTVQSEDYDRRIGFAVKLNLYRQRDPLMARELYEGIAEKYQAEKDDLTAQILLLKKQLDTTRNILDKPALRTQIIALEEQLLTINSRRTEEISSRAKVFVGEYWNSSSIDVAFARLYAFGSDSTSFIKNIRFNRYTGFGAWINGNLGIGRKILLTGLFRNSWFDEEVNYTFLDSAGDSKPGIWSTRNTLITTGLNLRYGGSVYTFFVEYFREWKKINNSFQMLKDNSGLPVSNEIIPESVFWDKVYPNSIGFGGDWRITRSVIINYGMRCTFDDRWTFKAFTPIVTISCMMR